MGPTGRACRTVVCEQDRDDRGDHHQSAESHARSASRAGASGRAGGRSPGARGAGSEGPQGSESRVGRLRRRRRAARASASIPQLLDAAATSAPAPPRASRRPSAPPRPPGRARGPCASRRSRGRRTLREDPVEPGGDDASPTRTSSLRFTYLIVRCVEDALTMPRARVRWTSASTAAVGIGEQQHARARAGSACDDAADDAVGATRPPSRLRCRRARPGRGQALKDPRRRLPMTRAVTTCDGTSVLKREQPQPAVGSRARSRVSC